MDHYSHIYSITAADMDTRYRMTPNAVLLYYQDCWARYMSSLHIAAFDVIKHHLMWVITEFNAWFEDDTALWSDDIDVTVWNSEVSALRLYAEFRIRRADGVEVAHGYGCWTLLDTETRRLAPNSQLPVQLPVLPEMCLDGHKRSKFPKDGTLLTEVIHRVNPINLDMNGHVNNRTYLSIAMQSANESFMDMYAIRSISIRWLRETFLGDTLTCRLILLPREQRDGTYTYTHIITREDGQSAAQIYSEWSVRTKQQPDISEIVNRN